MGRLSSEGIFYLHLILISFGLVVFTVLKNFNFEDYRASPDLSITQIKFIYIFLFVGIIGLLLLFVRGFFVKTPKYYTRVGIAMLLSVIGMVLVLGMLLHDELLGNDQVIGSLETLGILFGSFLTVMGSLAYISLKFPDDRVMKLFKQAVKEEIRERAVEEYQWKQQERQLKRRQQKMRGKQVRAKKKEKKAKGKVRDTVPEVTMSPAEGLTVVKCSKCQRSLKVTSTERPITIKCPYCNAIGVIKE